MNDSLGLSAYFFFESELTLKPVGFGSDVCEQKNGFKWQRRQWSPKKGEQPGLYPLD